MTPRSPYAIALLVFANMLTGTMLIPCVRPFFAAMGHSEQSMHAFFSVNMLGAALGAPLFSLLADRTGDRRRMVAVLALCDGVLLYLCTLPLPLSVIMGLRTLQGATSVGALSILMGSAGQRAVGAVHGGAIGLMGAAVVVGIAAGAPLGTLLLAWGPAVPFQIGALLAVLTAVGCLVVLPDKAGVRAVRGSLGALLRATPMLKLPTLWIGVERFSVGCFVVTFSLYAHNKLGLGDAEVGRLLSWFLLPFALMTWPMGALAERVDRGLLLAAGAGVYGLCFLCMGSVAPSTLALVLALAGASSAAIYAPSLCLAASFAPRSMRSTAMGLTNAGGTLGMLLGTATAGILTAVLYRHGLPRTEIYVWIFRLAGATQLVALVATLPALRELSRRAAHVRPALADSIVSS